MVYVQMDEGEWDVLQNAGLTEDEAKNVRTIEILNTKSSGGARIYDIYVRVPDNQTTTGISEVKGLVAEKTHKMLQSGRLVIIKDGIRYNAQGQKVKE